MSEPRVHRVLSVMHGPIFGGAHNQLVRLHPSLRAAGFETIAVLPLEAERAAARIEAAEIEVIRVPLGSLRARAGLRPNLATVAELRGDVRALRAAIRDRGIELVQVHGVINPHAAFAAQAEDVAIVWQLLDTRAPMPLRRLMMPYAVRRADAITSWGRAVAESHAGATRLGDRLILVYPPVDPALAPNGVQRERARQRLGAAPAAPVVGTLGVRQPQKGHEYFVRAAGRVRERRPDAYFRVLGAPSARHAEHMADVEREADRLGLHPPLLEFIDPGLDALALLQGLDVFVLTSDPHSEGMPTAILEAMACGKPVVATGVGAVRELVADGVTGIVVSPRDPENLAAAVLRLLDDRDLRDRMGAAGRERAVRDFRLDRLAQRHVTAYRVALAHRRRA